jgi:hypothetical protein
VGRERKKKRGGGEERGWEIKTEKSTKRKEERAKRILAFLQQHGAETFLKPSARTCIQRILVISYRYLKVT